MGLKGLLDVCGVVLCGVAGFDCVSEGGCGCPVVSALACLGLRGATGGGAFFLGTGAEAAAAIAGSEAVVGGGVNDCGAEACCGERERV